MSTRHTMCIQACACACTYTRPALNGACVQARAPTHELVCKTVCRSPPPPKKNRSAAHWQLSSGESPPRLLLHCSRAPLGITEDRCCKKEQIMNGPLQLINGCMLPRRGLRQDT
eukprot:scaffold186820_cov28-Tisochrysis_lutea.AAC.1